MAEGNDNVEAPPVDQAEPAPPRLLRGLEPKPRYIERLIVGLEMRMPTPLLLNTVWF